jgi:hypothetical protein
MARYQITARVLAGPRRNVRQVAWPILKHYHSLATYLSLSGTSLSRSVAAPRTLISSGDGQRSQLELELCRPAFRDYRRSGFEDTAY